MKTKLLYFTLLFFLSCITVKGQVFEPKPSGIDQLIFDLSIPPGQNLVAYAASSFYTVGGYGGKIIKTVDGGETWSTVYSHDVNSFFQIEFVSETRGFAVGSEGIMLKTTDGGTNWESIVLPSGSYPIYELSVLDFIDTNNGFVAGVNLDPGLNSRLGYVTSDSGESWVPVGSPEMPFFCGDIAAPNIIYSAGKDHEWKKTIDNGDSWTLIDWDGGPSGQYYFRLKFKDAENGLISTEDGVLRMTHDGGDSFNNVLNTGAHNFYALSYDGNVLYAGGSEEDIFRSTDNGVSWNHFFDGTGSSVFYSIEFFDNGDALICGSQGTILKANADALGVKDFNLNDSGLSHSYNDDDSILSLSTKNGFQISEYLIYNISGKLELSKTGLIANNLEVDVQTMSDGVYIAKCFVNNKEVVFKFVKY